MQRKILRGFTLIELLIVIAILAILSTLGISNFQSARIKARDAARKSDLQTIAKSLEAWVNDHRTYPSSATLVWDSPLTDGTSIYAAKLPDDPGGYTYVYTQTGSGTGYYLYAYLENDNDPMIDESITTICSTSNIECNYKISSSNQ